MQKIQDTIIGVSGIGVIETVPQLIPAHSIDFPAIAQTIIQLIIGAVTLLGLFRKKTPVNP